VEMLRRPDLAGGRDGDRRERDVPPRHGVDPGRQRRQRAV
jgi:hypothetical protein